MKRIVILLTLLTATARAQLTVDFTIDASRDVRPISPYIYGINWVHGGEELYPDWNLASRRLGGNRLSSYNWEINGSNSGNDCEPACRNQNDTWLTYRLPAGDQEIPALLPKKFHEDSRALGAYSLVQLQAAGYVAADRNDAERPVPPAPSPRWKAVRFKKGAPLSLAPDRNDDHVYMDEQVNYLIDMFGNASAGGIQGYAIDNEPGLWYTTHPRLRGLQYLSAAEVEQAESANPASVRDAKAKCAEVIEKSVELAKAVKELDPAAEIFGPAFWGFLDYYSLQNAPDWSSFQDQYGTYLDMYLDRMRMASETAGKRLLDVVDLHWYPQVGESPAKLMSSTRSLWDAGYKEDSWIANDVLQGPIDLFATLKRSVGQYYPGTKIAITEFRFGDAGNGNTYYSGIAVADALGIFGREGIYMAHYHPTDLDAPVTGYVASAYKIYRNYDGMKSTFGDRSVHATTSDVANSSVYASRDGKNPSRLHLIVINRSMTEAITGRFDVAGMGKLMSGRVYAYDNLSPAITERAAIGTITGNRFEYGVPPLTVAHVVLEGSASGVDDDGVIAGDRLVLHGSSPNPCSDYTTVRFELARAGHATVKLVDALGRNVMTIADEELEAGPHAIRATLDAARIAGGVYFCRVEGAGMVRTMPVTVVR